jgi:SulP family sulfate permease
MFFATSEKVSEIEVGETTKVVILRMRNVMSLDISALRSIISVYNSYKDKDIKVIFSHVNPQPMSVMKKAGFFDLVGEEYFVENIDVALIKAEQQL